MHDSLRGGRALLGAAALLAFGLGASAAQAQESYSPELRKLCEGDYKKLCAGTTPGGGRIRDCFLANMDKLSPECRAGVEAWKKAKDEKKG